MIELLVWPFMAVLVIAAMHVYLGLHVVRRGVIFVDLALAQVAALGTAVGVLLDWPPEALSTYSLALGFTFFGAVLFTFTRTRNRRVPQEAIIGITYVVAAALMILLLSKSVEGAEQVNNLLVGSILFVTPKSVGITFVSYAAIGLIHWWFRAEFSRASQARSDSDAMEARTRFWDFMFYITFGIVVTISVRIIGVLLVFSYLIIPAVGALLIFRDLRSQLLFSFVYSLVASALGMLASIALDIPTGAAIVAAFGLLLAVVGTVGAVFSGRSG